MSGGFGGLGGLGGFDAGNLMGALGAAILAGNRYAPINGEVLSRGIEGVNRRQDEANQGAALKHALRQAGFDDESAQMYSANPQAAKIAFDLRTQDRQERIGNQVGGFLGGLYGPASTAAPSQPATPSQAPAEAGALYSGLVQRGLPSIVAAGMVGNYHGESGLNPNIGGDKDRNGNPTSFGLGQWRGPRLDALKEFAASKGLDWRDTGVQLDHTVNEMKGGDAGATKALALATQARTPEESAAIIARHFERPAQWALNQSVPQRAGMAAQVYSQFGTSPTRADPGSTSDAPQPGGLPIHDPKVAMQAIPRLYQLPSRNPTFPKARGRPPGRRSIRRSRP